MAKKLCRKCGCLLPPEAFPIRTIRGKRVVYSPCRHCTQLNQAVWRHKNRRRLRQRWRETQRQWRKQHPGYRGRKTPQPYNPEVARRAHEKQRAKQGAKEAEATYNREYYSKNRERILEQKRLSKLQRALRQHGLINEQGAQQEH